jgi:Holliday junction resolvasome RuvABC endonuclease subunit
MSVMGLDLSLSQTGIATERAVLHLSTPASKMDGMGRLAHIRDTVMARVGADAITLVVLEGYSFASRTGGERLGELGGIVRLALYESGTPYLEVPPTTLKMFATGRGNAKKPEVISGARERLDYTGYNDNEADALWLRAYGMATLGTPMVDLPKTHLRALARTKVEV